MDELNMGFVILNVCQDKRWQWIKIGFGKKKKHPLFVFAKLFSAGTILVSSQKLMYFSFTSICNDSMNAYVLSNEFSYILLFESRNRKKSVAREVVRV